MSAAQLPAPGGRAAAGSALGILAGSGPLPGQVAHAARSAGREVFIVAFADFAEPEVIAPFPHEVIRLAAAGQILASLRHHGCGELVLIGPVRRPSLRDLRPDAQAAKILARLGRAWFAGDDGLLGGLIRVLGEEGFTVRGAHEFLPAELASAGPMGRLAPDPRALGDIARGVDVVRALGALDIGQGCVVQNGLVLAVEAMEGTDAMIERAGRLVSPGPGPGPGPGSGAVLVKLVKPGQDRRVDLPTIGPRTLELAFACGFCGVAVEAGGTLLAERAICVATADRAGLFLFGVAPGS